MELALPTFDVGEVVADGKVIFDSWFPCDSVVHNVKRAIYLFTFHMIYFYINFFGVPSHRMTYQSKNEENLIF